jgi:hypothetical protein
MLHRYCRHTTTHAKSLLPACRPVQRVSAGEYSMYQPGSTTCTSHVVRRVPATWYDAYQLRGTTCTSRRYRVSCRDAMHRVSTGSTTPARRRLLGEGSSLRRVRSKAPALQSCILDLQAWTLAFTATKAGAFAEPGGNPTRGIFRRRLQEEFPRVGFFATISRKNS